MSEQTLLYSSRCAALDVEPIYTFRAHRWENGSDAAGFNVLNWSLILQANKLHHCYQDSAQQQNISSVLNCVWIWIFGFKWFNKNVTCPVAVLFCASPWARVVSSASVEGWTAPFRAGTPPTPTLTPTTRTVRLDFTLDDGWWTDTTTLNHLQFKHFLFVFLQ